MMVLGIIVLMLIVVLSCWLTWRHWRYENRPRVDAVVASIRALSRVGLSVDIAVIDDADVARTFTGDGATWYERKTDGLHRVMPPWDDFLRDVWDDWRARREAEKL